MLNQNQEWQQSSLGNQVIQALSRQYLHQFKDRDIALEEVNLIYQQNSILKQIKSSMISKNKTSFLTQSDDNEVLSKQYPRPLISFRRTNDGALPLRSRASIKIIQQSNKSKKQQQTGQIENALAQVEIKCQKLVFKCLNSLFNNYKELQKKLYQFQNITNNTAKQTKSLQSLKKEYAELQKKYNEQQNKLKKQQFQLNSQKQTAQKDKKMLNNMVQRQKILVKSQTALLIKQRLISENIKKLNAKATSIKKSEQQVNMQRKIVQDLWKQIMSKSEFDEEFKIQVYGKCKQNLMKQRNILSQQQLQLQKQHSHLEKIISQLNGINSM